MDNFEAIPQGLLLEVPESGVADVVQRSVTEYLQEWLVVDRNGEFVASKDEMPRLVKGVCNCKCLPFDLGVPGLCGMRKSAPN